jgi:2'-phosphotransferase
MEQQKNNSDKNISKTMSWILRHGLGQLGLKPDNLGRIPLETLLNLNQMKKLNVSEDLVRHIVETSDKKRFNLEQVDGIWLIGANQGLSEPHKNFCETKNFIRGHSKDIGNKIDNSKLMELIIKPLDLCVHGTYKKNIEQIKATGLKTMSRTHIHMATGFPNDNKVVSGARNSANAFVLIDMEKAMNDGIKFYKSANGVILTEGIEGTLESKYFKQIIFNLQNL